MAIWRWLRRWNNELWLVLFPIVLWAVVAARGFPSNGVTFGVIWTAITIVGYVSNILWRRFRPDLFS